MQNVSLYGLIGTKAEKLFLCRPLNGKGNILFFCDLCALSEAGG
jgi:hypothetical protein